MSSWFTRSIANTLHLKNNDDVTYDVTSQQIEQSDDEEESQESHLPLTSGRGFRRRGVELDEEGDAFGYNECDSGAASDDFDLLELGETGEEFCQIGDQTYSIPFELYHLSVLEDILCMDFWNNVLSFTSSEMMVLMVMVAAGEVVRWWRRRQRWGRMMKMIIVKVANGGGSGGWWWEWGDEDEDKDVLIDLLLAPSSINSSARLSNKFGGFYFIFKFGISGLLHQVITTIADRIRGIAPAAIIDRQLPFEYTITSRSTDVVVMALPVQNINHSAFRSMFEREKLSGTNFNDWLRRLKLVLRVEKKMFVIEQPIPLAPSSELKSMFEKQARVERFDLIQTFHACKHEEGKPVGAYVLKMKDYVEQLERLGYVLPQDLSVGLILNGLTSDFTGFVRNYNMHNMGKTIGELHAMLIEYEKGLPKKAETPQVMMIKGGKIQKANKKFASKLRKRSKLALPVLQGFREARKLKQGALYFSKNNVHYFNAIPSNGIYEIDMHDLVPNNNSIYNVSTKRAKRNLDSTYLWHCRLAHISKKRIEKLQQEGLLRSTDDESFDQCVSCLSGKMTRKSFPTIVRKGVTDPPWNNTKRSALLLHIPHNTWVSERRNHTLLDMVRSMMNLTTLPLSFWDYALESATRILNMVSTKKVDKTPYELWYGKVPNLSYLKILKKFKMKIHHLQDEDILIRRFERTRRAPNYLSLNVKAEEHSLGDLNEPTSYKAVILDSESNKWIDAMNAEIQSMMDNIVWVLVDLPPACKTVGSFVDPNNPRNVCNIHVCLKQASEADMFLVYGGNPDAGFETDRDDTKSQTGYVSSRDGAKGTSSLLNEPGVQKGTRHYHRRYHYVRECIVLGEIRFFKVHTDDNLARSFRRLYLKGKLINMLGSMGLRLASSFHVVDTLATIKSLKRYASFSLNSNDENTIPKTLDPSAELVVFATFLNLWALGKAFVELLEEGINIPAWLAFNSEDGVNVVSDDSLAEMPIVLTLLILTRKLSGLAFMLSMGTSEG
ncbi:retrotransposon protein, putative, ty1-copia subclass [Tanacetum coccineum]